MSLKEKIAHHRRQMKQKVDDVRADERLSDEGRRQAIHRLYSKGMEIHNWLVEQYHAGREAEREKLHAKLFKPTHPIGQFEHIRAATRAEYGRHLREADGVLAPGESGEYNVSGLQRYLETCELAGDELGAKAAFALANEKGIRAVTDRYLENRPEIREEYAAFKELDRSMRAPNALESIADAFELGPLPEPDEIRGYQPEGAQTAAPIETVLLGRAE